MVGDSKKTRGRQKIEMKKIEDYENLFMAFSKRKSGICKQVSELITMCGADVGLVIFSLTQRPFSIGHPSIESITNRFLDRNIGLVADPELQAVLDAHRKMRINGLIDYLNDQVNKVEEARAIGKALRRKARATSEGAYADGRLQWWEKPLDKLSPQELKEEMLKMETFHRGLWNYMNQPANLAALGSVEPTVEPIALNDPQSSGEAHIGASAESSGD